MSATDKRPWCQENSPETKIWALGYLGQDNSDSNFLSCESSAAAESIPITAAPRSLRTSASLFSHLTTCPPLQDLQATQLLSHHLYSNCWEGRQGHKDTQLPFKYTSWKSHFCQPLVGQILVKWPHLAARMIFQFLGLSSW